MDKELVMIDKLGELNTNIAILNERIGVLNKKMDNGVFRSLQKGMNRVLVAVLGVLIPLVGFLILAISNII